MTYRAATVETVATGIFNYQKNLYAVRENFYYVKKPAAPAASVANQPFFVNIQCVNNNSENLPLWNPVLNE